MIVFPEANYTSFISAEDADDYLSESIHASDLAGIDTETLLFSAFRTISGFDISFDPTDTVALQALKNAQCEQAIREWQIWKTRKYSSLEDNGLKIKRRNHPPVSDRALNFLRPYMKTPTITLSR